MLQLILFKIVVFFNIVSYRNKTFSKADESKLSLPCIQGGGGATTTHQSVQASKPASLSTTLWLAFAALPFHQEYTLPLPDLMGHCK